MFVVSSLKVEITCQANLGQVYSARDVIF